MSHAAMVDIQFAALYVALASHRSDIVINNVMADEATYEKFTHTYSVITQVIAMIKPFKIVAQKMQAPKL